MPRRLQSFVCDGCNTFFSRPKGRTPGQKVYHSKECQHQHQMHRYVAAYSRKGPYSATHVCNNCGESYTAAHPSFCYCSDRCRYDARNKRLGVRYAQSVNGGSIPVEVKKQYKLVLLETQRECGICQTSFNGMDPRRIHLDHDHTTGEVRGLLCFNCNGGLGHFHDDPKLLLQAVTYLTSRSE
jgi:hypothetical protein